MKRADGKARVFLVDDHPIVRQGLVLLINSQPDLEVVGEAEDASGVFEAVMTTSPDILVADISLNGPDGLDIVKALRARSSTLPVLVLSMHDELIYASRALRAGANGYIMKHEATERLLFAIRRILHGDVYLSDRAANRLVRQYVRGADLIDGPSPSLLSDRELEVFRMIGGGRTTREIAQELRLSVKTIESYQAHIKEKLALRTARELVQHAINWSLSEDASSKADRRSSSG